MKKIKSLKILVLFLCLTLSYSCSNEELFDEDDSTNEILKTKDADDLLARSEGRGTLDDRCSVRNEVNRTIGNKTYKRYEIVPGTSTDPNNSVRIERYYRLINKVRNRKATFQATYRINRVDNSHTYIAQSHSSTPGSTLGPKYLIRAEPNGSNKFNLYRENILFNGGTQSNGGRDFNFLGTVSKDVDFTLKIVTGYNSSTKAFNRVYINGSDKGAKTHSRTDTTMRFRYGAYRAEASNATVFIRNVSYTVND